MKVKFSVLERLLVLNSLPSENDITTLKVVRKLKDQLGFNDEELKALNFRTDQSRTVWNNNVVKDKEYEIGDKSVEIIASALRSLNDQKKLTDSHISLYEKVVENGAQD